MIKFHRVNYNKIPAVILIIPNFIYVFINIQYFYTCISNGTLYVDVVSTLYIAHFSFGTYHTNTFNLEIQPQRSANGYKTCKPFDPSQPTNQPNERTKTKHNLPTTAWHIIQI